MTDLYKELSLNPDSSADDIQARLKNLHAAAQRSYSAALEEDEREHAHDRLILIREAMRVFMSDESKADYDEELRLDKQQHHEAQVLHNSKVCLSDDQLKDLLREALAAQDWAQVTSASCIIRERGCEDAEYYAAQVQLSTARHSYSKALSDAREGVKRFANAETLVLYESCISLGMACMAETPAELNIARQCIAMADARRTELRGRVEVLEIRMDLDQKHYPLVTQKVRQMAATSTCSKDSRETVCQMLLEHLNEHVVSHANNVDYFETDEQYQLYQTPMDAAICVAVNNRSELQNMLSSWEQKNLIKDAGWGLAGYILYALILFFAPGGLPFLGVLLLVMCVVTYVMLYVPKRQANYLQATGSLPGVNNVFRIINTVVGKWIQIIVKTYKWFFRLFLGFKG